VVVNWPFSTDSAGRFDFTVTANWNSTDVKRVPQTEQLAALNPAPPLFDRINVLTLEEGTPENKFGAAVNWSRDRFGATLRATRYGELLSPGTSAANDLVLSATTLVDLESRLDVTDNIAVAIGADNLLDAYPDENPPHLNTTGTTAFSNYSAFGRSGRFVYGRMSYSF
jgi:iron complex outermembrane receptor protein